ncbi:MAG: NUDIX hydrolase [Acidobacteriaceae bacterium]
MNTPQWLDWAREIQALAQTGLYYAENVYHRQRYERLLEIAAEITSQHSNLEYPIALTVFHSSIGYATPRVDVRGAVFQGKKILLVRERSDGGWTMPGGWADVGDTPSHAAEREIWEEAGFTAKASKIIGIYDANRTGPLELFHAFKIVFLCDLVGGEARPSSETSEAVFFGLDELPARFSGERTNLRHIQDAFVCHEQPDCPTVFD